MAWLDKRTASGSWRVARDFPNLPAWIVKAVGGSTTHWSGATPRFREYEFAARTYYGDIEGANLLDWPIDAGRPRAVLRQGREVAIGSTHRHGRPPLPANNNYKVFANGAEKVGYQLLRDRPLRHQRRAVRRPARPASRTASTSRATSPRPSGAPPSARSRARSTTGKCDLRAESQAVQITHDAQGRANAVIYLDKDGNLHRQAAKVVCVAGNSIESPRLLLMSASALHPDGLANSSGQVGRNYMRHTTGLRLRPVRGAGAHVPRRDDGRDHRRRGAAGHLARLRRRLLPGDALARPGVPRRLRRAGRVGAGVHRAHGRLREHRRPVDRR